MLELNLLYDPEKNHFNFVKTISGLIGPAFYCRPCDKLYYNRSKHNFPKKCNKCGSQGTFSDVSSVYKECEIFRHEFYNENCFKRHLDINSFRVGVSICSVRQKYPRCRCQIDYGWKNDNYDVFKFHTCGVDRGIEHKCFIQTISTNQGDSKVKQRKVATPTSFIFYDFGTTKNGSFRCSESEFLHWVNYAVAHKVCTVCRDRECERIFFKYVLMDKSLNKNKSLVTLLPLRIKGRCSTCNLSLKVMKKQWARE